MEALVNLILLVGAIDRWKESGSKEMEQGKGEAKSAGFSM
jgi:hypothetical protein